MNCVLSPVGSDLNPENPKAFPVDCSNQFPHQEGMTLRDYFAGQAISGIKSCNEFWNITPTCAAHDAYATADAMLAEREKEAK